LSPGEKCQGKNGPVEILSLSILDNPMDSVTMAR